MKITAISDTHTQHGHLGNLYCDVLIHSGDFTYKGNYFEIRDFLEWFSSQPAKYKILIAGNHELTLCQYTGKYNQSCVELLSKYRLSNPYHEFDIFYLENESITIEGIKFWGTPWTPWFHDWAFNGSTDDIPINGLPNLSEIYEECPKDTNIVVSHGPPFGILDRNREGECCGSKELLQMLRTLPGLKHVFFGHIHEEGGQSKHLSGNNSLTAGPWCHNASILNRNYNPTFKPIAVEYDG